LYFIKSPYLLRKITGKSIIWKMPEGGKRIFLTFDDGPVPEVTPDVLQILDDYNIKATFFCVGENVQKYPHLLVKILAKGHSIGCHTFNHLNGWKTANNVYIENISKCEAFSKTSLFRPPYGKITLNQINRLKNQYFTILWTVLSGDFDKKISGEQCLKNVVNNTSDGSIVVFHDSIKAKERLMYTLPRFIDDFMAKGYTFESIKIEELLKNQSNKL